jgi:hypothetical protein
LDEVLALDAAARRGADRMVLAHAQ